VRTRRFLAEEKEMGIGLNNTLKELTSLEQGDYAPAKEVIFLLCLNFLASYQLPFSESCRVSCWSS
jgi:hypothetical protein